MNKWRIFGWGTAAALLALPVVAMQFTDEVYWTPADFLFVGGLIGGLGLGIETVVRLSPSPAYRLATTVAMLTALLTILVNAAVGMIGSEDNPINLLFGGVIALALVGALLVRFAPRGMARVMVLAGLAQAAIAASGMGSDPRGATFAIFFAGLWFLAGGLFHYAQDTAPAS